MEKILKAKQTQYGLVELRTTGSRYALYVGGILKISTADLIYAIEEFDAY